MLDFTIYGLNINIRYKQLLTQIRKQIQLCSIHEQSIKITNEFSDYKNTVPAVVPLHNVNSFS